MLVTPNELAHAIAQTALPPAEHQVAIAVALAESAGETDALGVNDKGVKPSPPPVTWGSYDCGLWQINSYWHGAKFAALNWRDPYDSAELAYRAWLEGHRTWGPWSTFNSGAHVKFLPHAATGLRYPIPVRAYPSAATPAAPVDLSGLVRQLTDLQAAVAALRAPMDAVRGHFT